MFGYISGYSVVEDASRVNASLVGNVSIRFYLLPDTLGNYSSLLLMDSFVKHMLDPYFDVIYSFGTGSGGFVELRGEGVLSARPYCNSYYSVTDVDSENLTANILCGGEFAPAGASLSLNASFGPRFSVPLNRTTLTVNLPFENNAIEPAPDNLSGRTAEWDAAPPALAVRSNPGANVTLTSSWNLSSLPLGQ